MLILVFASSILNYLEPVSKSPNMKHTRYIKLN